MGHFSGAIRKDVKQYAGWSVTMYTKLASWPRGYKTFFMLNSAEHEIFSANKC